MTWGRNQSEKDTHNPTGRAEPSLHLDPVQTADQLWHLRALRHVQAGIPFMTLGPRFGFAKHGPEATGGPGDDERRRAHRGGDSASAGRAAGAACLEAGSFKCSWEARPYEADSLSSYGTAHDGD